jgi:hypothetical protein
VGELARVAGVADVPDQVLVGELVEFMVRERLEVHGGCGVTLESAKAR